MVNISGTVIARVVKVAGIILVESTTPGRILPTVEPMPGKKAAPPKFPPPPKGVPSTLVKGGAIALPVRPKLGPVAPMNGNCLKGCPPEFPDASRHGGPAGRNSGLNPVRSVEPPVRTGGRITAGPVQSRLAPKYNCEFGR